jgi:hypothetical protein
MSVQTLTAALPLPDNYRAVRNDPTTRVWTAMQDTHLATSDA